jgi:hypothetical protein
MGQYTRTNLALLSALTPTWINTELAAIATALNSMASSNFPAGVVPNTALANKYFRWQADLHVHTLGAGVLNTAKQDEFRIPMECTLVSVYGIATAVAGAVTPTFDVYEDYSIGGTVLTGPVSINSADTPYSGTILHSDLKAGWRMSLRMTTNAGDGSASNVRVTLWFKATHTT